MFGQGDSRPANVAFQREFCLSRILSNDAIHNHFVLHVCDVGIRKFIQLRKGATIVLRGVPNALNEFLEHSIVGSRVGQEMKFTIKAQEALDVGSFFNLLRHTR